MSQKADDNRDGYIATMFFMILTLGNDFWTDVHEKQKKKANGWTYGETVWCNYIPASIACQGTR